MDFRIDFRIDFPEPFPCLSCLLFPSPCYIPTSDYKGATLCVLLSSWSPVTASFVLGCSACVPARLLVILLLLLPAIPFVFYVCGMS